MELQHGCSESRSKEDNTEFTFLRRQLQQTQKSHIQEEFCVGLSALRLFYVHPVYEIGEVTFHLIGTNGFHARGKE